jgi:ABC-2 type transport system ATP-binding protein
MHTVKRGHSNLYLKMIRVNSLQKNYGDKCVLNIAELDIPEGQSFGLVGNNGAGKTTFFSLLLDLIEPSAGNVLNHEISVHESENWKPYTAAFLDETFLIGYLTPEEYFYFIGELRGVSKSDVDELIDGFKDVFNGEILNQKKYLRDFSKGNQKKIGIVAAFIGNPKVVILDEPFANLDPTSQIRLKKTLKTLTETDTLTLLVSSHDLMHVTEVCERIVVLSKGEVVRDIQTTPETLRQLESYFEEQTF